HIYCCFNNGNTLYFPIQVNKQAISVAMLEKAVDLQELSLKEKLHSRRSDSNAKQARNHPRPKKYNQLLDFSFHESTEL
ncbi:hypothetical protein WA026_008341, partial [Henosepilachna vigintioctopunctata]